MGLNWLFTIHFTFLLFINNCTTKEIFSQPDATSSELDQSPQNDSLDAFETSGKNQDFKPFLYRTVTKLQNSNFVNPSYPNNEKSPIISEFVVIMGYKFCALRIDVLEANLSSKTEGCSTDSIQIINSLDSPSVPQCGLLDGFQYTVQSKENEAITILVTSQTETKWNINVSQILCSAIENSPDLLPKDCGIGGEPKNNIFRSNNVKLMRPIELLRKRTNIAELNARGNALPENLLRSALLNYNENLRIVKGNETGVHEFPWQVLILGKGKPLCGGSLISKRYILTAGHCTALNTPSPLVSLLMIDLGDHDLRNNKESQNVLYTVEKIIPNIQHDLIFNDISLIKLGSDVEFNDAIRPVCLSLPEKNGNLVSEDYSGKKVITSGWGKTENSVISPVLLKAELEVMPTKDCKLSWELLGTGGGAMIQNSMICAGGGDVGPCNGDSGGPLVIKTDEDKFKLIGITSFGAIKGCGLPGVPTVFTKVDSFINWILINIAE